MAAIVMAHAWRVLECLCCFEMRADVKDRVLVDSFAFKDCSVQESHFSFRNSSR